MKFDFSHISYPGLKKYSPLEETPLSSGKENQVPKKATNDAERMVDTFLDSSKGASGKKDSVTHFYSQLKKKL
jgi:hypothetical protein